MLFPIAKCESDKMIKTNTFSELSLNGFSIIPEIYSEDEIAQLITLVDSQTLKNRNKETFRKSVDLFAIRQFLKEVPKAAELIFSDKLKQLITTQFGSGYFVTKSIYFDKPEKSNWFVPYHQDLTIAVNTKVETDGFENWTVKQGQFSVQPPTALLERCFTVRIHLDDTTKENGALKILPESHSKGVIRMGGETLNKESAYSCEVPKGGIMIMKPLLLHASDKTTNNERRRVIHIEFCNCELPGELEWNERSSYSLN